MIIHKRDCVSGSEVDNCAIYDCTKVVVASRFARIVEVVMQGNIKE